MFLHVSKCFVAGIGLTGEMIVIQNVSRYCDDVYECIASNGVPPTVSRQMRVTVECTIMSPNSLSFFVAQSHSKINFWLEIM